MSLTLAKRPKDIHRAAWRASRYGLTLLAQAGLHGGWPVRQQLSEGIRPWYTYLAVGEMLMGERLQGGGRGAARHAGAIPQWLRDRGFPSL